MKRFILPILLILGCLLGGCRLKPDEELTETGEKTDPPSTESEASPSGDETAYLDIECYQPNSFSAKLFGWESDRQVFSLQLPDEWEISDNDNGGMTIARDGKNIGEMISGTPADLAEWDVLEITEETFSGITAQKFLEMKGAGDDLSFRCRFVYQYESEDRERTISITVTYEEIGDFTSRKLLATPDLCDLTTDPRFGILSDVPKQSILILGNSFIGTSDIGQILKDMLYNNRKNVNVSAVSRGYATVETYISDSYMMSDIRNGVYDIIFICGFYSADQAEHLDVLQSACAVSDTTLVIFPAHNENENSISIARAHQPSLICLNWKQEIDALITSGVDRWALCIDDTYRHSTPLAGFVGAHMIYRALYGTVPSGQVNAGIS